MNKKSSILPSLIESYAQHSIPVLILSKDGIIEETNNQGILYYGSDRTNLIGHPFIQLLVDKNPKTLSSIIRQLSHAIRQIESHIPKSQIKLPVVEIESKNDGQRYVEISPCAINGHRNLPYLVIETYDVTRWVLREHTEMALRITSETLSKYLDLDLIVATIKKQLRTLVPQHASANLMLVDKSNTLIENTSWGYGLKDKITFHAPSLTNLDKTPTFAKMHRNHKPVLISDTTKDLGWKQTKRKIASYLGTPIIVDDKVIGYLSLNSPHRNSFTTQETEILTAFTKQVALAVNNARLHGNLISAFEEVKRLAETDGLTGLLNRRTFDKSITEIFSTLSKNQKFSLFLFDVDFFKQLNDKYGHLVGDERLRDIAKILRQSITSIKGASAFRYGGDEFAAIVPNFDTNQATELAEKILSKVRSNRDFKKTDSGKTLTIGIATYTKNANHYKPTSLIDTVDQALLAAKKEGRDRTIHADTLL